MSSVYLICFPCTVTATCSQSFYFSSAKIDFSFHRNYGGEKREERFISDIKELLPTIVGLEKGLQEPYQFVEIFVGCQQHGKAYLKINNTNPYELECKDESLQMVISTLLERNKITIEPLMIFEGYTLQIAYAKNQNTASQEIIRWEDIITAKEYPSSIIIDGDCTQTPLWIQKYPKNWYGIRFGIFNTLQDAKKAIRTLKLGENHSQILRVKFNIGELENYFY